MCATRGGVHSPASLLFQSSICTFKAAGVYPRLTLGVELLYQPIHREILRYGGLGHHTIATTQSIHQPFQLYIPIIYQPLSVHTECLLFTAS